MIAKGFTPFENQYFPKTLSDLIEGVVRLGVVRNAVESLQDGEESDEGRSKGTENLGFRETSNLLAHLSHNGASREGRLTGSASAASRASNASDPSEARGGESAGRAC